MANIRLDKYLADAGIGTRSQVKEILKKNRVYVNDAVAKKGDIKIDTDIDVVALDGKAIGYQEYEYFMLNKPQGVVSATKDPRDKTVVELITENKRRDLFPVGRLDKDTEGLLIITNDGKLANNLLAPGKHVDKKYYVEVSGNVTEETVEYFKTGIDIGDEEMTLPAKLEILNVDGVGENATSACNITIMEGRYHQIKRMFKACGMEVLFLKRLSMGPVSLDEDLPLGGYRKLTEEEIKSLKEVHKI
ncbi:MAG: rRNA pseudouridine synthase [Lachnospiraceae bacterium]|nr:rRNA pseudouridine synthase [Lachnospiraceae bacterium]